MGELMAKLLELFTVGSRKALFRLLILVALLLIVGPILVNYLFGFVRLEQQVRVLKSLAEIDADSLQDLRLKGVYDDIVDSITKTPAANTSPISAYFSITTFRSIFRGQNLWKFLTGAGVPLLLLIVAFFAKFTGRGQRVGAFLLLTFIGLITGLVGALIPTFDPLVVNLVGFPLIQLAFVIYLTVLSSRAKGKTQAGAPGKPAGTVHTETHI